ncbi:hypothetical protein [Streptomyces sp. 6N223]|uniref:hypothetical protein n=1 Tax=Streptomyces sp. 6N223 TaxID=3457412 RepID=UPI003FD5F737
MSWHTLVDAFRYAAAPARENGSPDRKTKARVLLPPVVVRAAGDTRRAAETLAGVLNDGGGRCVAHVSLTVRPAAASPHEGVASLCDLITPMELRRAVVEQTGRLRLPNYSLMCDIVEWLRRPSEPERPLRDFCFERKRERRPFLGGLWKLGGAPADGFALAGVWNMLGGPFFQLAPRWQWARGLTRHLLRSNRQRHGWYRSAVGEGAPVFGVDFFEHVEPHVKALLEGGDAHDGSVAERQRELDRLLVHALLADLARWARPTRVAPWRRRRVTRFVFLVHLPDEGIAEGNRWEHFFEECGSAVQETRCGAALWVAVGPRDAAIAGVDGTLADAADVLRSGHGDIRDDIRPLRVPLPAEADHPRRRPARRSIRPTPGPRLWATVGSMGAVAILLLFASGIEKALPDAEPDPACLGGSSPDRVAPSLRDPAEKDLRGLYRDAWEMIEEENARADQEAAQEQGRTVRTIAYMAVPVNGDWDEDQQRSDGAVPELRGIALAQRALNDEARSNDLKVWLRVKFFNAGEGYRDAPDAARDIVDWAEAAPDELIGVVGIAQSWDTTREAVQILSAAQIPTIATNATADEMQSGVYFHQIAPPSSREAEIATAFTRQAGIVRDASGGCAPARAAVVVQDPNDLYSMSLGTSFSRQFASDGGRGSVRRLWYSPDAGSPRPMPPEGASWEESVRGVAVSVCERIRRDPDTPTVVYWASRAREFDAFLDDFGDSTPCAGEALTVVGGNGLTNPALSGTYENHPWLRLYHAAHVLPVGQSLSHVAVGFNAAYAQFGTDDPWRNDGHAALAYDTMQVMAEAANEAYASTGGQSVNRESVQVVLNRGVERAGASGAIDFPAGEPVSRDKPLVILHHTDEGSEPVLSCGTFAPNAGSVTEWGPGGAFDCPRDD